MKDLYESTISILKNYGFYKLREGKDSHQIWTNDNKTVTVPYNLKPRHTANAILKQANINKKI
ncbi:type II toxin-antitoxin system HicA family toxin [Taylorella equigenitalis]|uniref:type II toxin-antitoxin system HicA family toxin n=1 Tax=Taylorella equigenitalis TaxID=29575 RepID=UPI00041AD4D2|nr:addiction module toxin, HicA family [Taylorella equigenitalis]KOS58498.1 hypothetical protein AM589_06400 [Taylorella equigenitalis]